MEPRTLETFLADPGGSYKFVTWLRRFLDDPNPVHSTLLVVFDGEGSALTTGVKGDAAIKFPCTIVGWTLLADQSGSLEIDIWKDTFANYPPTVADSIVASAPPTLSSTDHNADIKLTGWNRAVEPADTLRFNITTATTVTRATLALQLWKPASHP